MGYIIGDHIVPAEGDIAKWDGAKWVLTSMPAAGVSWTKVFDGPGEDVPTASVWSYVTDMPLPGREDVKAVIVDGKLYVIGGYNHYTEPKNRLDIDRYDPATDAWVSLADFAGFVSTQQPAGLVDSLLWAICVEAISTWKTYDPSTQAWTDKVNTSACGDQQGYVDGTDIYYQASTDWIKLDTTLNTLDDTLAEPTYRHTGVQGGIVGGVIYCMGGRNNAGSKQHEAYDIAGDSWTDKADLVKNREEGVSFVMSGLIYVAGGWYPETYYKDMVSYDQSSNDYTAREDMPGVRKGIGLGGPNMMDGTNAYVPGGGEVIEATTYYKKTCFKFEEAEVYILWEGTLNTGDAVAIYRPGGTARVYADGKIYNITGSGTVFPIFTDSCPVRVEIPYTDAYADIEVWKGEV